MMFISCTLLITFLLIRSIISFFRERKNRTGYIYRLNRDWLEKNPKQLEVKLEVKGKDSSGKNEVSYWHSCHQGGSEHRAVALTALLYFSGLKEREKIY